MATLSVSFTPKKTKPNPIDICIIGGCGHVGLPLGLAFAEQGQRVALLDINEASIQMVNDGIMPFGEDGAPPLLKRLVADGHIMATNKTHLVQHAKVILMVIGTPVDEHLNPRYHEVIKAVQEIEDFLSDDQLLVLRSTLYPGVTERVHNYLKSKGINTKVAFCPERIAEGKALTELHSLPQLVSGCTPEAEKAASDLFRILAKKIITLAPKEAELAKLYTNTWRYINFAISNQYYMIATSHNLDFYKIHDAMTEDYPRLKGFATAGFAAGPCLFKDAMQLSSFATDNFFMGHAAMLINEGLPDFVVDQLEQRYGLSDKTVGILGMAFKANHDDPRESLSYKLKKKLELHAKAVLCTDVYIKDSSFCDVEQLKKSADIIIVATPHREYANLTFEGKIVVDMWNLYQRGSLIT